MNIEKIFKITIVIGMALLLATIVRSGNSGVDAEIEWKPKSLQDVYREVIFIPSRDIILNVYVKGGRIDLYFYSMRDGNLYEIIVFKNISRIYEKIHIDSRGFYEIVFKPLIEEAEIKVSYECITIGIEKDLFQLGLSLTLIGILALILSKIYKKYHFKRR